MKRIFLVLIFLTVSLGYFGDKKIFPWSANLWSPDAKNHMDTIWKSYKRARQIYMNGMGNSDPCWKAFRARCGDATHQCNVDWLVPGLVNLAISATMFSLAAAGTAVYPELIKVYKVSYIITILGG